MRVPKKVPKKFPKTCKILLKIGFECFSCFFSILKQKKRENHVNTGVFTLFYIPLSYSKFRQSFLDQNHSKCVCLHGHVGSNPTFSAKNRQGSTEIPVDFTFKTNSIFFCSAKIVCFRKKMSKNRYSQKSRTHVGYRNIHLSRKMEHTCTCLTARRFYDVILS